MRARAWCDKPMGGRSKDILIINPNTTVSMTAKIGEAARSAARPESRITAINPATGPAAIQGAEDGEAALPGLFSLVDEVAASHRNFDALIIACFDDTGLWTLKQRFDLPVLGIGEAAYHTAALFAERFTVVTTLPVSIPVLEGNLERMGLAHRCSRVRASDIPVLDLEDGDRRVWRKIHAEIAEALEQDDCGAIALGCAGMANLAHELSLEFKVPVIDGVAAAVRLAEVMLDADCSSTDPAGVLATAPGA